MNATTSMKKRYRLIIESTLILNLCCILIYSFSDRDLILISSFSTILIYLLPLITSSMYFRVLKNRPENIARFYMLYLLSKFVYSTIIIGIGSLLIATISKKTFILSLAITFTISLIVESRLFIQIEKNISYNETNH